MPRSMGKGEFKYLQRRREVDVVIIAREIM